MPKLRKPDGRLWLALEETEREQIHIALEAMNGNITHAANYLEVGRSWMHRACLRHAIDPTIYRKAAT